MVTVSAQSTAIVFANGDGQWLGRNGGGPGGDLCPGDQCVRADAGSHTVCVMNADGTCRCDGSSATTITDGANAQRDGKKLLKCAVGYLQQGCCLREDGVIVCVRHTEKPTVPGTDWAWIAEYIHNDRMIAVKQSGVAYELEIAQGEAEASLTVLHNSNPILAAGFDRVSKSLCLLSASPATYGEVICQQAAGEPPAEIAAMGVASPGCVEFPRQVLDIKRILTTPGAACSDTDRDMAALGIIEEAVALHLSHTASFGILLESVLPLTPTSGHVRLFIDINETWTGFESEPEDRIWSQVALEGALHELDCSQGGRTYNGAGVLGGAMGDPHVDVRATELSRNRPEVWCVGGFTERETAAIEGRGLVSAPESASHGVRVVVSIDVEGGNGTALAVSAGATRLVPRRRHINSVNMTSGLRRDGGDGIRVSGSCLGGNDMGATAHLEPFAGAPLTPFGRSEALFIAPPGIGNGSAVRFTWQDSLNGAGVFNYTVSGRQFAPGSPCDPVAGWACITEYGNQPIPLHYSPPVLGAALPPVGLNQSGTEPLFVELHVPDAVAAIASKTTRMWVGPEECTQVTVLAGSVRCLSMPKGAGGPHAVRVQLLGGQLARGSTSVQFRAPDIESIVQAGFSGPAIVWPSIETNASFIIRGNGMGQRADHVRLVTVGGHNCEVTAWHDPTRLDCTVGPTESFGQGDVVVWTGGVQSSGGERMLEWQLPPVVAGGIPGELPVDGGGELTVIGQNFGENGTHIREIRVGSVPCLSFQHRSPVQLMCVSPPGVGTGLYLEVETTGGIIGRTKFPAVGYESPTVTGLEPRFAFSDENRLYDFNISGRSLGLNTSQVSFAAVGGSTCGSVSVVSSQLILCKRVRAVWTGTNVQVVVSGQVGRASSIFEFLPPPRVLSIEPDLASTRGGTVVRVLGEGLGSTSDELLDVTVGGLSCTSIAYISPSEVTCVVPPGVGTGHEVRVQVQHQSVSSLGPTMSYERPTVVDAAVMRVRNGTSTVALVDYMFGGESSVDIAFRADEVGSDAVIHDAETSVEAYLENPSEPDWTSDCQSVDDASDLAGAWAALVAQRLNASSDSALTERTHAWGRVLVCRNVSLAGAFRFSGQARIRMRVAGQLDRVTTEDRTASGLIDVIGHPIVDRVFLGVNVIDGVVPISGLGSVGDHPVELQGSNFGQESGDVLDVLVGDNGIPVSFEWVSSTVVQIALPAGVGVGVPVVVRTRGGILSAESFIRYKAASIASVSPSYVLSGPYEVVLNVSGEDLGNVGMDLDRISVGSTPCYSARWITSKLVQCVWRQSSDWIWTSGITTVSVVVGEQQGQTVGVLQTLSLPEIDRVAPKLVDPGEELLLIGSNFGQEQSDVASVEVDGIACDLVQLRTPTAVVCAAPTPKQERLDAAVSDVSALANLTVVVVSRTGLRSNAINISYVAAGTPLVEVPQHITSWRPVGRGGSVVVRWTYPTDDLQDSIAAVQSFDIELSLASVDDEESGSDAFNATIVRRAVEDIGLANNVQGGQVVYGEEVVAPTTLPLRVRIRGINPTSQSNWSDYSSIVTENCDVDEYLQTQLPLAEQACAPCPREAYCGGMPANRVVALRGYWRVPWSASRLGFVRCEEDEACQGFDPNLLQQALSSGTGILAVERLDGFGTNASTVERNISLNRRRSLKQQARQLQLLEAASDLDEGVQQLELPRLSDVLLLGSFPTAIPVELWPQPSAVEGCTDGYGGIMCASCEGGFTPADGTKCRRCEDRSVVIVAAVFVALLLLLVVLGLTFNAVISKGQTSVSVAAAKVLFSHLQTVAVALRLPFQYPPFIRDLFEAMNSMSSVNTDVLALDCMLTGTVSNEDVGVTVGASIQATNASGSDFIEDSSESPSLPLDSRFLARSIVTLCIPLLLIAIAAVFWCIWPAIRTVCCAPCAAIIAAQDASKNAKSSLGSSPSRRQRSRRIMSPLQAVERRRSSLRIKDGYVAGGRARSATATQDRHSIGTHRSRSLSTNKTDNMTNNPLQAIARGRARRSSKFGVEHASGTGPRASYTGTLKSKISLLRADQTSAPKLASPAGGDAKQAVATVNQISTTEVPVSTHPVTGIVLDESKATFTPELQRFAAQQPETSGRIRRPRRGSLDGTSQTSRRSIQASSPTGVASIPRRSFAGGLPDGVQQFPDKKRMSFVGSSNSRQNLLEREESGRRGFKSKRRQTLIGMPAKSLLVDTLALQADGPAAVSARGSKIVFGDGEKGDSPAASKVAQVVRGLMTDDEVVRISLCDRVLTTAGVVAFLVHMTETQVALSLMTCTKIEFSEEAISTTGNLTSQAQFDSNDLSRSCQNVPASQQGFRLLDDLELCCHDGMTQAYMFGLGMPALLLYSMGIPIVTGVVLWLHQGELTDPRVATTFGFMRAGYKDEAFWFECVVMLRKALLVCIAVGLAPLGIEVQTYAILGLLFAVALVQALLQPFSSSALNRLELTALVTAFVTFDAGLYLGSTTASSSSKMVVNASVFIANVVFLIAAASVIIGSKFCGRCQSSEMKRQAQVLRARYAVAKRKHERGKEKAQLVEGLDDTKVQMAIAGSKAKALMEGKSGKVGKAGSGRRGRSKGRGYGWDSSDSE